MLKAETRDGQAAQEARGEKVVHQLTDWSAIRCRPASRGLRSRSPWRVGLSLASRHFKRRPPSPPEKKLKRLDRPTLVWLVPLPPLDCLSMLLAISPWRDGWFPLVHAKLRTCVKSWNILYFFYIDRLKLQRNSNALSWTFSQLPQLTVELSWINVGSELLKFPRRQDGSTRWRRIIEEPIRRCGYRGLAEQLRGG